MSEQDAQQQDAQQQDTPVFNIEKIYVKDLSVEVPNAPRIFLERDPPQIDVNLRNETENVEQGIYQVVMTVVVTAKTGDKTAFLVEAQQAGIFRIQNVPQEAIEPMLAVGCANIIFPYARETVSEAISRAGFPPMMLQPMNFEALYMQQKAQLADQAAGN